MNNLKPLSANAALEESIVISHSFSSFLLRPRKNLILSIVEQIHELCMSDLILLLSFLDLELELSAFNNFRWQWINSSNQLLELF